MKGGGKATGKAIPEACGNSNPLADAIPRPALWFGFEMGCDLPHVGLMSTAKLTGLSILIVEDDPMLGRRLAAQLERLGAEVSRAETLLSARALTTAGGFDLALLDVNLPDGLGTDLLKEKFFRPDTAVIVMTAHGGVEGAVEAMRWGAVDYLVKPFETGELPLAVERARQARQAARVEEHRREENAPPEFYFGPSLASLEAQVSRILKMDRQTRGPLPGVLIQGETGTGKTALARLLHERGPRASGELVEVNCSALPEALAESELFGHEAGAFTDARKARMGLFEAAHGGTLFLDEIPSLSTAAQAKVLIAIEEGKIRRVGSNKSLPLDVRVIAATNRDLSGLVAQGLFREDLLHRLDLYRLSIPPLRDRGADITKLAEIFAARFCHKHRLAPKRISAAGRSRLLAWPWPGNVRELAHELERAVVFEESEELGFPLLALEAGPERAAAVQGEWLNPSFQFPEEGFVLDHAIDQLMRRALDQAGGNASAAARLLGVPRDFVRYRLKRMEPPQSGK